jgi:hypothetical protein
MADVWDQFPDASDPWADFPDIEQPPQTAFQRAASGAPVTQRPNRGSPVDVIEAQPGGYNFGASLKENLVRDPETKIRLAAESLFPGDTSARERFGFVNGRLAYATDDGGLQYVSNRPTELGAALVANVPEIAGGIVGSLSSSPFVGGVAGVTGARGLKDAAAGLLFDEPQTIAGNLKDVGVTAGVEAATGGTAKLLLGGANRGRVLDLTPDNLSAAQAKRGAIRQATGVETDLALASGDPRLLALRNFLKQQPNETGAAINAADDLAESQFDDATRKVLDIVAQPAPADTAGRAGVNAAKESIRVARQAVRNKVQPMYQEAYAALPEVTDPQILGYLKKPYFPQALAAARRLAKLDGVDIPPGSEPSLQVLDYTKQALDDVIEGLETAGKRSEARALRGQKNAFVKLLDESSGDAYKRARAAYQKGIKETVEPLEKGAVGVLAKIPDQRAASAAAKIFRDENVTAGEVARVRQVLEKQDPEAWRGLVRQHVSRELNQARRATQGGGEVNVAGKLHQRIWGDPASRARMNAALGSDASDALKGLMETAETLAQAPARGSNTQPNLAIQSMLEGPSGFWMRALMNPKTTVVQGAAKNAVEKNSDLLWQALTDPAKVRQLKIAVKISDPAKRATLITATILGQSSRAVASQGTEPEPPPQ